MIRERAATKLTWGLLLLGLSGPVAAAESSAGPDASIVEAGNQFAFDLYGRLARERPGGNLFFSPASVAVGLSMTAAGARGATEAEMLKVLHVAGREARRHAEYHKLLERWNASAIERGYEFRVANRLWVQEGLALESDYRALTSIAYGAELGAADFADQGEAARAEINRWVAERTNDRIKHLLAEPLDRKTRLVLANAIYFKGDWSAQFDTAMTQPGAFAAPRGIRTVPFMHQARSFRYYEDASMQALELPYKGGELAMLVLLPRPTFELARVESAVSPPSVAALRAKLAVRDVSVYLPKFRMETASRLEAALAALGMKLAFGAAADFSGIAPEPGLSLSAVVHKAFVDVGEEGTEAAAATAAAVGARSFTRAPDATVFRADRPFLFMICDNRDGGIIFLGRLTSPGD